jgi:tetratricopeptide (TPR) repeat protein
MLNGGSPGDGGTHEPDPAVDAGEAPEGPAAQKEGPQGRGEGRSTPAAQAIEEPTMASNRIGDRIETLIASRDWASAQGVIEKQLGKEPDDHWLWARLSGVKYEQRDYKGALDAAEKALTIVPDCPLALWSYAGPLEMLGRTKEAGKIYIKLIRRGLLELKEPDEDADECWEGADWTRALVVDCMFRTAGCLAAMGKRDEAIEWYGRFLNLVEFGMRGIYSRRDALAKLRKVAADKKAMPDVMETMRKLEVVMG